MSHWIGSLVIAAICVAACFARLWRDRKLRQAGVVVPATRKLSAAALPIFLVPWGVCAYFIWYIHSRGLPQSSFFVAMFAFLTVFILVAASLLIRQRDRSA